MATLVNTDGSAASGYSELRLFSSDTRNVLQLDAADLDVLLYTSAVLSISSGTVPTITSSAALTLCATSIPLKTEAAILKMTITPATANLINAASGTSLDLQYNGTSRIKYDSTGIGFFNVTPVARPGAFTQTYSTATHTQSNVTAVSVATTAATNSSPYGYAQAQADAIVTNLNALIVDHANTKQVLNAAIDDLQSLGLLQ